MRWDCYHGQALRKACSTSRISFGRYESACRDLGLVAEQKDWLLDLLMAAKNKVDEELDAAGGGHI